MNQMTIAKAGKLTTQVTVDYPKFHGGISRVGASSGFLECRRD